MRESLHRDVENVFSRASGSFPGNGQVLDPAIAANVPVILSVIERRV